MTKKNKRFRGYSSRKVDVREVKERFLIVCEGEKTEPNYFRSFRVSKKVAQVDIKGIGRSPSELVAKAKDLNDEGDYDQVWCVFDRDEWKANDFNSAMQSAASSGFKVAYSNEAFELWYVLHFEFLNTGVPRQDYAKKLSSLLGRKYQKNSEYIYEDLLKNQHIAIRNADKLLSQYQNHRPATDNPSTAVHLLVQALNKYI